MVDAYSNFKLPTIPMAHIFQHSPIEHLFYISLCSTMPEYIWKLSYIMPQKQYVTINITLILLFVTEKQEK